MTQIGLLRHSTVIFWPGSSLPTSTSTGAPAAFARSLGQKLIANGTAAAITPTVPTAVVAPSSSRRFPPSTFPSPGMDPILPANFWIIDDLAAPPEAFPGNKL